MEKKQQQQFFNPPLCILQGGAGVKSTVPASVSAVHRLVLAGFGMVCLQQSHTS